MSRLTRAIAIRTGEGRLVALVAGAFAAVDAGRGLGEVGVDTLVLTRFGEGLLPPLFIGLGLVGLIVTLAYGAALTRSSSQRFFPALLVIVASVLVIEWLVALSGVEAIIPLVWISVYAAGLLLLTVMWTVGGFTFDARQAKRLFPLLTSAAIVGSLAGFLGAIVVQRLVGAEALILAEALLLLGAAALLSGLGPRARPRRASGESVPGVLAATTAGAAYVVRSPLMRLVAIAYVLLAILLFSVTFPFLAAMRAAFPEESELLPVLALFSAAVTAVSFLTGTLLANRLYVRFGVATVALALPLVYLLGFGLWMGRFVLATALIVRFAQQVTQRGISNAAWSAFYSVVPGRRRGQVLAFMDGVPGQMGTMLSGVLLIIATSLAMEQVFVLGLVTAMLCLVVGILIRRAYASSLVATLREGRGEQVLEGGPGLLALAQDGKVISELRAASRSSQPAQRLLAADLLARLGRDEVLVDLRRLCGDDDPAVRRMALRAVAGRPVANGRKPGPETRELLISALTDEDDGVRAVAVSALGGGEIDGALGPETLERLRADASGLVRAELAIQLVRAERADEAGALVEELLAAADAADRIIGLEALARIDAGSAPVPRARVQACLEDPAPAVRSAALRAAAAQDVGALAAGLRALDDPARQVRLTAAAILRERPEAQDPLLTALREGSARARESALLALEGHADGEAVRRSLLGWAQDQVRRATELRGHAAAFSQAASGDGRDGTPSAAFLAQVIRRREQAIEAGLLQALAVLGAPEASGLIRRCLRAIDPEVRAQAIEALDALGDARLARGVVQLLDREAMVERSEGADVVAATAGLVGDPDPWVRALALRTRAERLHSEQEAIAERVRGDPDPIVQDALRIDHPEEKGGLMTERLQLVSDIDRMLFLRRVPIFAALDPEDLQRVASSAREQSWGTEDILMAEGELGDELVVIVEGSVRVVRGEGPEERVLRRYGEGDHIGELAVLREAPRAATVIAEEGGIRGLVISGEAIQALLAERPEAAKAMLATLAERISQQG